MLDDESGDLILTEDIFQQELVEPRRLHRQIDPDATPFKSKYKARDTLLELHRKYRGALKQMRLQTEGAAKKEKLREAVVEKRAKEAVVEGVVKSDDGDGDDGAGGDDGKGKAISIEKTTEIVPGLDDVEFDVYDDEQMIFVSDCMARIDGLLGINYIECEEWSAGEPHLQKCLKTLRRCVMKYPLVMMETYSQLGILWSNRNQHDRAGRYLQAASNVWKCTSRSRELIAKADGDGDGGAATAADATAGDATSASGEGGEDEIKLADVRPEQHNSLTLPAARLVVRRIDDDTWHAMELLYTHVLYYMAQVAASQGKSLMSAKFCHRTLQRQLEQRQNFDIHDWCTNCIQMSTFYTNHLRLSEARYCLQAVEQVCDYHTRSGVGRSSTTTTAATAGESVAAAAATTIGVDEAEKTLEQQSDEVDDEKVESLHASLHRAWAIFYLRWLEYSRMDYRERLLRREDRNKNKGKGRDKKKEMKAMKAMKAKEKTSDGGGTIDDVVDDEDDESDATSDDDPDDPDNEERQQRAKARRLERAREAMEKIPVLLFPSLPLAARQACLLARSWSEARALYLKAIYHFSAAMQYFVLDGFVTDYIGLKQQVSEALNHLQEYVRGDDDRSVWCKILRRRINHLEPLIAAINPVAYQQQHRQLCDEVAKAYQVLADHKFDAMKDGSHSVSMARVQRANELCLKSIKYFQIFVTSFNKGDKRPGEGDCHIEEYNQKAYVMARFMTARAYSKVLHHDPNTQCMFLRKCVQEYNDMLVYARQTKVKEMDEELQVAEEMSRLLVMKIQRISESKQVML